MKKITRWRPDTCECVIEYEWDTDLPSENRTHILKKITKCQAHESFLDEDSYIKVKDENVKKNVTKKLLLESMPELSQDEHDEQGNVVGKKEKSNVQFFFNYDVNRDLNVTFTGIDNATKTKLGNEIKKLQGVKLI